MRRSSKYFFNLFIVAALFSTGPLAALEVGDKAPCVVLDGVSADGSDTRGCIRDAVDEEQVFTILDFFSVHCSTCLASVPNLSRLASELAGEATVRQVSIDRNLSEIRSYLEAHKDVINFPVSFDVERDAKKAYGVFLTPTIFVLKKIGPGNFDIVFKHQGLLTDAFVDEIKEIVHE